MNTLLVVALVLFPAVDPPADSETVMQPTQGVLTADSDLYSGPGMHYYPVIGMKANQTVTVVEEKHGYLGVIPIDGTFSLIAKEFVDTTNDRNRGVVNHKQVWVHAGSTLTGKNFVKQTRLSEGAIVEIIDERDGFYMIAPPPEARLWVPSKLVAIVDDQAEAVAEAVEQPAPTDETPVVETPPAAPAETPAIVEPPVRTDVAATQPADAPPARPVERAARPTPSATTGGGESIEDLEQRLRDEYTKDLRDRDLTPIITGFQELADTSEDEETVAYAEYRARQLTKATRRAMALKTLEGLDREVREQRRQFMIDRADIRPNPPLVTRDYAVMGRMIKSFAYTNPAGPQRFRLVDGEEPHTRTVAYVEIEPDSNIDPELFMGRYVGVRARTKRLLQGAVEPVIIYTAAELVVLEEAPVAAEAAPEDNT